MLLRCKWPSPVGQVCRLHRVRVRSAAGCMSAKAPREAFMSEEDVGICCYANDCDGFSAIIKQRLAC